MKSYPIVLIRWIDSNGRHGWHDIGGMPEDLSVETVGFLLTKTRAHITVTATLTQQESDYCELMIPRAAINEIKYLTVEE